MSFKFYLMRHAEAESGEELDPTRELTETGHQQAKMMAKWIKRQGIKPDLLLQSNMHRAHQTAKRIEHRLGVERTTLGYPLDPNATADTAWAAVKAAAAREKAKEVIAVTHGPLIEKLMAYLVGSPIPANFSFAHAAIAHLHVTRGGLVFHWMVTPNVVARDEDEMALVTHDAHAAIEAALSTVEAVIEADDDDTAGKKRWILGASGNHCDDCQSNADAGWIDEDDSFPSGDDDAPAHPNCDCEVEYGV